MTSLDDELREILLSRTLGMYASNGEDTLVPVNWEESPLINEYIAQIKQVFQEEGYISRDEQLAWRIDSATGRSEPLMTGQEWFSRFERILTLDMSIEDEDDALEVAKKASGIE